MSLSLLYLDLYCIDGFIHPSAPEEGQTDYRLDLASGAYRSEDLRAVITDIVLQIYEGSQIPFGRNLEDFKYYITTIFIIVPLVLGYFGYILYGLPTTQTGLSITQYKETVGMNSIYLGYVIRFLIGFIPYFISIIREKSNKTLILILCGIIFSSYMWGLYLSITLGFQINILLMIGWVVTLTLSFLKD